MRSVTQPMRTRAAFKVGGRAVAQTANLIPTAFRKQLFAAHLVLDLGVRSIFAALSLHSLKDGGEGDAGSGKCRD